jgi:hypothetical protein
MVRKTISRSRLVVLVAVVLAAGATAGAAQDPQRPATYTVKSGDTLWDIAGRLLGDPFQWPQIYRLNTAVVEDPHWIYPGEVLRLEGGEGAQAVPAEETPAPAAPAEQRPPPMTPIVTGQEPTGTEEYPMPAFARRRLQQVRLALESYVDRGYRPLRPGEFYSSGFLTEERELPFGEMLGGVTPQQIRNLSERTSATLYTTVAVRPPEGASYAVGDTLLVVQMGEEHRGYGLVVLPTGLVRITEQTGNQYLGEIVAVYAPIRNGQRVLPAERFSPGPDQRAVDVNDGLRAEVIGGRELRELKHPQNVVFLNVGRDKGVAPGDVFEVRRRPGPRAGGPDNVEEPMARGQVVRVGERTSTLLLINIISPDIPPETPAVHVGRLPAGTDR